MERFTVLTAIAAPMPKPNINTDDIYPGPSASPVVRAGQGASITERSGMGLNAFAAQRWNDDLSPRPDFVLNRAPYDRAQILITGENFGCGSSREMAVWCLHGIGIRCIIAPSFGDIFFNNCFKSAVLPIRLPGTPVEHLMAQAIQVPERPLTVDLPAQAVRSPDGETYNFEIGAYHKQALLEGLDEIAATLARLDRIDAFEQDYWRERSWLAA